jgi:hypothetical protein
MKPTIKIETTSIVFPVGGGGHFLASLLFDAGDIDFTQEFNEFKINEKLNSKLSQSNTLKCYWTHLDDVIANDTAHNSISISSLKHTHPKHYVSLGHYLPIVTNQSYDFDCPDLLEITCENETSEFIISVASFVKNNIFTDFFNKNYQLSDIICTFVSVALQRNISLEQLFTKITEVNLTVHINKLKQEIHMRGLGKHLIYKPNTVTMWKFICYNVINDIEISLASFNEFIFSHFKADSKHFSLLHNHTQQNNARMFLKDKFGAGMQSVEYGSVFYDLQIPENFKKHILPAYSDTHLEMIATYSINNLILVKDAIGLITQDAKYLTLINDTKSRLGAACNANNLSHLITKIQEI